MVVHTPVHIAELFFPLSPETKSSKTFTLHLPSLLLPSWSPSHETLILALILQMPVPAVAKEQCEDEQRPAIHVSSTETLTGADPCPSLRLRFRPRRLHLHQDLGFHALPRCAWPVYIIRLIHCFHFFFKCFVCVFFTQRKRSSLMTHLGSWGVSLRQYVFLIVFSLILWIDGLKSWFFFCLFFWGFCQCRSYLLILWKLIQ